MIRAEIRRGEYGSSEVVLTVDRDGGRAFAEIVEALLAIRGAKSVEVDACASGATLRLVYESQADREKREKELEEARERLRAKEPVKP